jgi:hypothetical protein
MGSRQAVEPLDEQVASLEQIKVALLRGFGREAAGSGMMDIRDPVKRSGVRRLKSISKRNLTSCKMQCDSGCCLPGSLEGSLTAARQNTRKFNSRTPEHK